MAVAITTECLNGSLTFENYAAQAAAATHQAVNYSSTMPAPPPRILLGLIVMIAGWNYAQSLKVPCEAPLRPLHCLFAVRGDTAAAAAAAGHEDQASSKLKKKKKTTPRPSVAITHGIVGTQSLFGEAVTSAQYIRGETTGEVAFTVFGEPIPLRRHMMAKGHMYNPSSAQQRNFARACADHLPLSGPLEGPLEATLTFFFSRPASHYRTGKFAGTLKPGMPSWHSKRKDLDNLIKFVLDSLNGIAYLDDSQVAVLRSAKFYTNGEPRSEVRLRRLVEKNVTREESG